MGRKRAAAAAAAVRARQDRALREQLLAEWRGRVRALPPAARLAWLEQQVGVGGPTQGTIAFGAAQRKQLCEMLKRLRRRLEDLCPCGPWYAAAWERGEPFPPVPEDAGPAAGVRRGRRRLVWMEHPWQELTVARAAAIAGVAPEAFRARMRAASDDGRLEFAVRGRTFRVVPTRAERGMPLSREPTRWGEGLPRRRPTPAPAVATEDAIDGLSHFEALIYQPSDGSASAAAIRRIGQLRGRELDPWSPRKTRAGRAVARGRDRVRPLAAAPGMSAAEIVDSVRDFAANDGR